MFMKYSYTEAGSEVQQPFFLPDTLRGWSQFPIPFSEGKKHSSQHSGFFRWSWHECEFEDLQAMKPSKIDLSL